MKNEKLNQAFADIDASFIEEAAKVPNRKKTIVLSLSAVAACLAVAMLMPSLLRILSVQDKTSVDKVPGQTDKTPEQSVTDDYGKPTEPDDNKGDDSDQDDSPSDAIPDTDDLAPIDPSLAEKHYSAAEIAEAFNNQYDGPTKAYSYVYAPNASYFKFTENKDAEWLTTAECVTNDYRPSNAEFAAFINTVFPRLADAAGLPYSQKVTEEMIASKYNTMYESNIQKSYLRAYSFPDCYFVTLSSLNPHQTFQIDQIPVALDQTQSDAEIISSLAPLKEKLCSIFDAKLPDTKIVRKYDAYSQYGVTFFTVYFYNSKAHPLNDLPNLAPFSDYIELHFDNVENWNGDCVSSTVITDVSIEYRKFHTSAIEQWQLSKVKQISLETAIEHLNKGYLFGFHICDLCMQAQDAIDFSEYDHISLEYKISKNNEVLPFYAFYKYTGRSQNNNEAYAVTYVAAFEIEGLEDYFKEQENHHK